MRFNSDKDLELAEDADPAVFPSERSRRRAIGFDRWAGRHPVLITLLTGAGMGGLLWLALLNAPADRFALRLVFYVAVVVVVMVGIARLALKARKKYHRR